MPDHPGNGYDPMRLDRMERMMEFLLSNQARNEEERLRNAQEHLRFDEENLRNAQEHLRFDEEHRKLQEAIRGLFEAHDEFQRDHKLLLTAQILLTDRLDKLVASTNERNRDTDARLNILVHMFDDWIRRQPPPPQ